MAWKYFGEWNNIPLFYCLFWYHPEVNRYLRKYFNTSRELGICVINRKQHLFLDTEWLEDLREQVYSIDSQEIIKRLESFYPEFERVRAGLFAHYQKSFEHCSNKEIEKSFREILGLIRSITPFDQYCMISEQFHLEKLQKGLHTRSGVEETHLSILCSPTKITSTQEEELSLITLALGVQQGEELTKSSVDAHLRRFGWLPLFLFGKSWDGGYVREEVSRLAKENDLQLRKEHLNKFPEEQNKRIKELQEQLSFSKELEELSRVMQEIAFIRNEAETMISLGTLVLQPIYEEIYKRTGLSEEERANLTPEEIGLLLLEKEDFSEVIAKRLDATFYVSTPETFRIYDSVEAFKIFSENYRKQEQETNSAKLKGMCASAGKVIGKISIVRTVEDMDRFSEGDVLVSESTCIDFVPVMRRSAAILTEMGGITSHAAIVSRELAVPCIVGISGLLKCLKNGQKVEVDASLGIVTLID